MSTSLQDTIASPRSRVETMNAVVVHAFGEVPRVEEVAKPIERELDIRLDDYASLARGQVTFAITQNGWEGKGDSRPAWLLLIDAKEKSGVIKTNLARLRKKWVESGKTVRTEKIREFDFSILSLSSNDVPKALKQFLDWMLTDEAQQMAAGLQYAPLPKPLVALIQTKLKKQK